MEISWGEAVASCEAQRSVGCCFVGPIRLKKEPLRGTLSCSSVQLSAAKGQGACGFAYLEACTSKVLLRRGARCARTFCPPHREAVALEV